MLHAENYGERYAVAPAALALGTPPAARGRHRLHEGARGAAPRGHHLLGGPDRGRHRHLGRGHGGAGGGARRAHPRAG